MAKSEFREEVLASWILTFHLSYPIWTYSGRLWTTHRLVLNVIWFVLVTGAAGKMPLESWSIRSVRHVSDSRLGSYWECGIMGRIGVRRRPLWNLKVLSLAAWSFEPFGSVDKAGPRWLLTKAMLDREIAFGVRAFLSTPANEELSFESRLVIKLECGVQSVIVTRS